VPAVMRSDGRLLLMSLGPEIAVLKASLRSPRLLGVFFNKISCQSVCGSSLLDDFGVLANILLFDVKPPGEAILYDTNSPIACWQRARRWRRPG
jgi:hypothetical protein